MDGIRKAVLEDIPQVAAIYDHILTEEEQGRAVVGWIRGVYPTERTALDALEAGTLFVLERDGMIAAAAKIDRNQVPEYANAPWRYPDAPADQVMVLHTLVVDPAFAGQGCGKQFVAFYERYALDKGCPYLRMDTNAKNAAARRLYAGLGYWEAGIVPCVFNGIPDVQLVCLEKKLAAVTQHYNVDSTLLDYQLIILKKFKYQPKELQRNQNITVQIKIDGEDEEKTVSFPDCHIDDTEERRLYLPLEVMIWIKNQFPISVAYFADKSSKKRKWMTKRDTEKFHKALYAGKQPKLEDIPVETLRLTWVQAPEPYMLIQTGFQITLDNAAEVLSAEAMAKVLPYIFSSAQNTFSAPVKEDSKKCYIIDQTTPWLPASKYAGTGFSHPGIYILRRKQDGQYYYYIGKAADIKNRIISKGNAVCHPNEKDEDNKQYDDICCVSVNMDQLKKLYGALDDTNQTPEGNPGVPMGSLTDRALYAVEDIAIHIVSMVLLSEGKRLDNRQYRSYTSAALAGAL